MEALLLLLIFPIIWPLVAKFIFKCEFTPLEIATNIAVGCLIVFVGWHVSRYAQTLDYEVWNGQVVSKDREQVSCSHSYSCNCRQSCSGSGKDRSCSTTCDTCYEHSHDYDWNVRTTIGDLKIDRIDSQGVHQPQRWTAVAQGQPVAQTHSYTNYVKAVPESLFNKTDLANASAAALPPYPLSVYDYHYLDRVIPVGVVVPDIAQWNTDLAYTLRDLGPSKQANVVIVITKSPDMKYTNALSAAWLGGKKNDVIVVIGAPEYPKIAWVDVISWTDKQLFKVQLRDDIMALSEVDRVKVMSTIHENIMKGFTRKHMADFEYLKDSLEPSAGWMWFLGILSVLTSAGLSILFSRIDLDAMVGLKRRTWR